MEADKAVLPVGRPVAGDDVEVGRSFFDGLSYGFLEPLHGCLPNEVSMVCRRTRGGNE